MSYRVTYFDFPGKGEAIRLLFVVAGVDFEDKRIKREDWPQLKSDYPWDQLPVLHVGDKILAQSDTIMRYLARKFNLTGADEWEAAKCEELGDAINDFFKEWHKYIRENDEDRKAEQKKHLMEVIVPKYLSKLNTIQQENGGNFMVGKTVTWVDILIADRLVKLEESVPVEGSEALNKYPHLKKMKEAVFAIPAVKAWVDAHPIPPHRH